MKEYIIKWVVMVVVYMACPEEGKKDEFGVVIPNTCTVPHHTGIAEYNQEAAFYDRDSAYAFYNRGKAAQHTLGNHVGDQAISGFEIDSIQTTETTQP